MCVINKNTLIVVFSLLLLAACGSGGKGEGTSAPVSEIPQTEDTPGTTQTPGGTGTPQSGVNVTAVRFDITNITLMPGDSKKLTVVVEPSNATNKTLGWESSDPDILAVAQDGVMTGKKAGSATVTVTSADGAKTDTCSVEVSAELIDDKIYSYAFPGGSQFRAVLTPEIAAGHTFPCNIDKNDVYDEATDIAPVPGRFIIGETEVPYGLWREVLLWAVTDAGDGKRVDGGVLYNFHNHGREGSDGVSSETAGASNEPVAAISWRDALVWCNALTEYYNSNNGDLEDLDCVYCHDAACSIPIRNLIDEYRNYFSLLSEGTFDRPFVNQNAKGFRLPTSIEWEFAARYRADDMTNSLAGSDGTRYTKGDSASGAAASYADAAATGDVAVFDTAKTAAVKSGSANALGLYDMSGNVYEWCFEWFGAAPAKIGDDSYRILRGGGYNEDAQNQQLGIVSYHYPYYFLQYYGLRVVRNM